MAKNFLELMKNINSSALGSTANTKKDKPGNISTQPGPKGLVGLFKSKKDKNNTVSLI